LPHHLDAKLLITCHDELVPVEVDVEIVGSWGGG
jgi:hypothetical protein